MPIAEPRVHAATVKAQLRVAKKDDGRRVLEGHAAVFNSDSRLMVTKNGRKFVERIKPGAFARVLKAPNTETKALIDHDESKLLARRSKRTLDMSEDDKGLAVEISLPNTTLGNDTEENVANGNLDHMSFAFTTGDGDDEWTRNADGTYLRTIKNVAALLDVTLTDDRAAYPDTDLYLRMADESIDKLDKNAATAVTPLPREADKIFAEIQARGAELRASMLVEDCSLIYSCRAAMYYFRQAFDYANSVLDTCARVQGDLGDDDQRAIDDVYGAVEDLIPKLRAVKAALDAMGAEDVDDDAAANAGGDVAAAEGRTLKMLRALGPAEAKEMLNRIAQPKAHGPAVGSSAAADPNAANGATRSPPTPATAAAK